MSESHTRRHALVKLTARRLLQASVFCGLLSEMPLHTPLLSKIDYSKKATYPILAERFIHYVQLRETDLTAIKLPEVRTATVTRKLANERDIELQAIKCQLMVSTQEMCYDHLQ